MKVYRVNKEYYIENKEYELVAEIGFDRAIGDLSNKQKEAVLFFLKLKDFPEKELDFLVKYPEKITSSRNDIYLNTEGFENEIYEYSNKYRNLKKRLLELEFDFRNQIKHTIKKYKEQLGSSVYFEVTIIKNRAGFKQQEETFSLCNNDFFEGCILAEITNPMHIKSISLVNDHILITGDWLYQIYLKEL